MDGVVNVLILKKHHLLNFSLLLVSSGLDENLVQFIVGYKETQTNIFKMFRFIFLLMPHAFPSVENKPLAVLLLS